MKRLLSIVLLVFMNCLLHGQYNLSGKVTETEDLSPLPGAHVLLEGTFRATTTMRDGTFHIDNLKPGEYAIKVTYVGYKTENRQIILDGDIELDISLQIDPILQEEVIIRGTRAAEQSAATYSLVSKETISRMNSGQDLPFIIQNSPSVVTTSDAGTGIGYTGLRIRGTDLTRINVTINGIPLNDAESQGVWWVDLPDVASSLENIQIQRGVGTSTNGPAAFGASINLQTQKLDPEPYAEVTASAGSFGTWKTSMKAGTGLIRDHWAFDARYSKVYSDGYIDRAYADLHSFYVSGGYFSKKTIVKAIAFSGFEKTYQAWDGVPGYLLDSLPTYNGLGAYYDPDGNLKYYDDQTDNYHQSHYQLHWVEQISRNWDLNMSLHYTQGKGYYEEYKMDQDLSDYALDNVIVGSDTITASDLVRRRWLDNDFTGITFSFQHDSRRNYQLAIGGAFSNYQGNHYGEIIWSRAGLNIENDFRWYENKGKKNDANLYAKATIQLTRRLGIYGDLQFRRIDYYIEGLDNDLREITQSHFYNFFNPKVGFTLSMEHGNKLYAFAGVANREPNRSTLVDANPEKPYPVSESLLNLEAGYDHSGSRVTVSANLFYMGYRNQLVLTGRINDVGDPVMENVPESYRAGAEFSLGARLCSSLTWEVNATASINKIKNFTEYVDNWDEYPDQVENKLGTTDIAFSPALTGNSIITYKPLDFLDLRFISKYVGSQFIDNTSSRERKLDAYFVNDLLVRAHFSFKSLKELGLNLRVSNLFNTQYITNAWVYRYYYQGEYDLYDGYFPQAGIHFMAGVDMRF